jgi:hypothetical protein
MAFDYARIAATADVLLKQFGQVGAIRRSGAGAGEPWGPAGSTVDHRCTFVITEYTVRERDGTLIKQQDKRALISVVGLSIQLETSDKLMVGGVPHEIVNFDAIAPAGTTVVYDAQVRR